MDSLISYSTTVQDATDWTTTRKENMKVIYTSAGRSPWDKTWNITNIAAVHLRVIGAKNKHWTLSYDWYIPVYITSPYDPSRVTQAE